MTTAPDPAEALRRIERVGVVPVVTIDDPAVAGPLCGALGAGGLDVVEITLRTSAGLSAIEAMAGANDGTLVGAGSIRTAREADDAIAAGAHFLVSPGLDPEVVTLAAEHGVLAIPGIATATELMRARSFGVDVVKLFPAEACGGTATVSALAAVFPDVRFMPTGGVSPDNAGDYLALPAVVAVGGSWMAPASLVGAGDWDAVTAAASGAAAIAGGRS